MQRAVGIVGFGLLGAAIARRLRDAGHVVSVIDIDHSRMMLAQSEGVLAADGTASLCASCPTLIIAVYSPEQAREALATIATDPGAGRAVLCVTTLDPDSAIELAEIADVHGIAWIEYPISGSCRQVAEGHGLGIVAASPENIAKHQSIIDAITPRFVRVGGAGSASRAKLAVNLVLELNRSALAEGLVFAEMLGLELNDFVRLLRSSAAASNVMNAKANKMLTDDFAAEGRSAQSLKDVTMMLALAEARGQRLPFAEVQHALLADCVAFKEGDLDSAVVISAIRRARFHQSRLVAAACS